MALEALHTTIDDLINMQLGDERKVGPCKYLRVPGGWLVHVSNLENAPICFVPEPTQQEEG